MTGAVPRTHRLKQFFWFSLLSLSYIISYRLSRKKWEFNQIVSDIIQNSSTIKPNHSSIYNTDGFIYTEANASLRSCYDPEFDIKIHNCAYAVKKVEICKNKFPSLGSANSILPFTTAWVPLEKKDISSKKRETQIFQGKTYPESMEIGSYQVTPSLIKQSYFPKEYIPSKSAESNFRQSEASSTLKYIGGGWFYHKSKRTGGNSFGFDLTSNLPNILSIITSLLLGGGFVSINIQPGFQETEINRMTNNCHLGDIRVKFYYSDTRAVSVFAWKSHNLLTNKKVGGYSFGKIRNGKVPINRMEISDGIFQDSTCDLATFGLLIISIITGLQCFSDTRKRSFFFLSLGILNLAERIFFKDKINLVIYVYAIIAVFVLMFLLKITFH